MFFVVACRLYLRTSYTRRRNQNHAVIVTQQQTPRLLIGRVTHIPSAPPPPPAYTPYTGYTPVPPSGYQPVPTTSSVAQDDIPSDPPPEYTPTRPTNVPMPIPTVNENS